MKKDNFKRTLDFIRDNPGKWDQTEYDRGRDSPKDFIGWAAVLSGDTSHRDTWIIAIEWLGITAADEAWISAETRTLAELQAFYEQYPSQPPQRVEAVNLSPSTISGLRIVGLLCATFVVLKLLHVITWSWWWVASPAWIGITVVLAGLVVILGRNARRSRI